MSYDTILAKSPSIIYRPGGVAGGLVVTTWAEVQAFIALREGAVVVYVDDSIVSPALVPGATGVTECFGRVEIRPYAIDPNAVTVLQIEPGATLQNLTTVSALELRCNAQSLVPSLAWTVTSGGGVLNINQAALSNAATATEPIIFIAAGKQVTLFVNSLSFIIGRAPAVPLVNVSDPTALLLVLGLNGSTFTAGYAEGPGTVRLEYDNVTGNSFSPVAGVPPPLPLLTGPYVADNLDSTFPSPGPWSQAAFFIDPANSTGLAADDNSGADALHPVLSYNFGVAQKWGTYSPMLRQNTTLTWLSSQPANDADPVVFTPIMVGAVATIQGTLGPAQEVHTGALAGVVPKNRATKQLLQADLGFAATPGQIVHNTTAGKDSWAFVYKNVSGTVFAITQPLTGAPTPIDETTIPSEVDTWANGDTFVLYAPVGINLVRAGADVTAEYVAPNFPMPIQLRTLTAFSSNGDENSETYIGTDVAQTLVNYTSAVVDESVFNDFLDIWWNCFCGADVFAATGSNMESFFWGGAIVSSFGTNAAFCFDLDAIIGGTSHANIEFTRFESASSLPNQGIFYIDTGMDVRLGGNQGFRAVDGLLGLSGPWGPGTIGVTGMSRIFYNPAAGGGVLTFGNIGSIQINQQSSVVSFDPTSGLWSTLIPLTAANLDLPFASGGFGGLAINVGGGSLTNQAGS